MAAKKVNQGSADEEKKLQAAAEATMRKAKAKKQKGAMQYKIWIALGVIVTVMAVFLAASGPTAKKGGVNKMESLVNGAAYDVTKEAAGNFTAAASTFFNKWTYDDVKYGLSGVAVRGEGMMNMAGGLQSCDRDESTEGGALPASYDVREEWPGCLAEVQDSGNCSASYAVAAATSLAARFCMADGEKYKKLRLSSQQILSCDKKSKGCQGGGIDSVFSYIERRGLYPEECLPFAPGKKPACKTTCKEEQKLKALNHCVLGGSEKLLKREIYNQGPVVVPAYLRDDFLVYQGGVYTPVDSSKVQFGPDNEPLLEAVVVIGWGKSDGVGYWTIQNSWGESWGEKGYARVSTGSILREGMAIVATPATEEAVAAVATKKAEEEERYWMAKKERQERDARIAEAQAKRAEEMAAAGGDEGAEDVDFEDIDLEDVEAEVDLE